MKNTVSLKKPHEFRRLYTKGASAASSSIVAYLNKNGGSTNKLGITVSAKLGGAVVRNRIKRRIREAYRSVESELPTGRNIVFVARKEAYSADFEKLKTEIVKLTRRIEAQPKRK